jgi:PAS domain S-box-containing protein
VEQSFIAESLLRSAGDGIVVAGPDGRIAFWNAAAERVFGFSEREALGRSLDLIIPEKHRAAHWKGWEAVLASGTTRYGEQLLRVPALHKEGRALSIAFTVALLKSAARGELLGVAAIVRDETARWAEERALRRRIAELEAKA